jgi:methionine biosynthesis protein MetW
MNVDELYKNQYANRKLKTDYVSFRQLRNLFKKYDIHREDSVVALLEKGENLLDIGCGSGSLLYKAKDKYTNLYGIDIVEENILKAKELFQKNNRRVELTVMDVNNGIEFSDNFLDTVTIIAVLEHLFDPFFILKEIHRVLKPGGILILQVPNIAYLKYRLQLLFGKLPVTSSPYNWPEIGWDGGHLHYFTLKSLKDLFNRGGFKIEKISGSGLFANFRNWWPSLLCGDIIIKARKIEN